MERRYWPGRGTAGTRRLPGARGERDARRGVHHGRDDGRRGRVSALRRAGPRQGAPARRHPRPALLRASGPAHLAQAPLVLRRSRLRGRGPGPRARRTCRPGRCSRVRAGAEATRQVGELALPVAVVANELGVCWWTVMDAVVRHGTPLVDDPARVGYVRALGIDETSFLSATRDHHTIYATGLVDLDDPNPHRHDRGQRGR